MSEHTTFSGEIAIPTPAAARQPGFWSVIRDAIRGTHHNYTDGPIGRGILMLAVPMVLEMLLLDTCSTRTEWS